MINREELITLTQEAVRIESLSGQEGRVTQLLARQMKKLGYDEIWIDAYGNLIGKIYGTGEGKSILFDGHTDTVPINSPEKWTFDPFGAEIFEGKMYGRGTSDMKGAVCAAVMAGGEIIRQIQLNGHRPKGDIYICCSVYEEVFEGCALSKVIEEIKPDHVVIMEPSNLQVVIGQLGRAEITIHAHGKSTHSSKPEGGINAIYELVPIIHSIQHSIPPNHDILGKGISVVTDIISSPFPGVSIVPDLCKITIDRRLIVGESEASVLQQYHELLPPTGEYTIEIVEADLTCYTGKKLHGRRFFPGWMIDESDPLVITAMESLRSIDQQPSLDTYKFCTNGSYSAGVANIPTIGYGPSRADLVHIVDEYIELDQLYQAAEGFVALAKGIVEF